MLKKILFLVVSVATLTIPQNSFSKKIFNNECPKSNDNRNTLDVWYKILETKNGSYYSLRNLFIYRNTGHTGNDIPDNINFSHTTFDNIIFNDVWFKGMNFNNTNFFKTNFGDTRLHFKSKFINSSFHNTTFNETDLSNVQFEKCTFEKTIFENNTNLRGTIIKNSTLQNVEFDENTNLKNTQFTKNTKIDLNTFKSLIKTNYPKSQLYKRLTKTINPFN